MRQYLILALVLAVFLVLLSGCINPFGKKEYVCSDGKFVSDPFFCFSNNKNITSVSNMTANVGLKANESRGDLRTITESWD